MSISRRTFLQNTLNSVIVLSTGALVLPQLAIADWSKTAFDAKTIEESLMALFNNSEVVDSDKITITTPDIAENGKVVPVEVKTDLPKVESISIFAKENPVPLIAQFNFPNRAKGFAKTRIKMAKTSDIVAIVKAEGKLYRASREVKVTIGGCGG